MRKRGALGVALAGLIALIVVSRVPISRMYLLRSPEGIEAYLRDKTPLGSSEDEVIAYLGSIGVSTGKPFRGGFRAGDYPLSSVDGEAYLHEAIGRYQIGWLTVVQAFYIFDSDGRLIDLRVRKTKDTL